MTILLHVNIFYTTNHGVLLNHIIGYDEVVLHCTKRFHEAESFLSS